MYIYEIKYIKEQLKCGGLQTVKQQAPVEKTFCCSKIAFNPKFYKWVGICEKLFMAKKKWGKTEERKVIAEGVQSSTQTRRYSFSTHKCKEKP